MHRVTASVLFLLLATSLSHAQVKFGIDCLADDGFKILQGKKVGIVANPASVDSNLVSTVDRIRKAPGVSVVALFGPEHGIWGDEYAGVKVVDRKDPHTNIPIFSVYGKTRKPTTQMIKPLDVLVFDLQDIGSRSYTYISTLKTCMEACAEHDVEFVVLDRPNPLGGERIEGPGLEKGFESFVGYYPVPYVHGMTMGELANYVRDNYYPTYKKLTVVKMQGWNRSMVWVETGHAWVPTSPHIPKAETCAAYATTGILGELYIINIGVGYTLPFEMVGAPWIDAQALSCAMPKLKGVSYRQAYFKPFYSTFKGEACEGVEMHIDPKTAENLVETNYRLIEALGAKMLFEQTDISFMKMEEAEAKAEKRKPVKSDRAAMFDKVSGSDEPRKWLLEGKPLDELFAKWKKQCEEFRQSRTKYLLY